MANAKSVITQTLRRHQPKYDDDGPRGICECNSSLGGSRPDRIASHQASRVYEALRQARMLAE